MVVLHATKNNAIGYTTTEYIAVPAYAYTNIAALNCPKSNHIMLNHVKFDFV